MRLIACYLSLITFFGATSTPAQDSKPILQKTGADAVSKPPDVEHGLIEGKVIRVIDGDTIRIKVRDRTIHSIRLQGVDAPEGAQEDADTARRNLSELVLGENVRVVAHKTDQSGLIIGTVYLRGRDVGLAQIESGLAWHFKQFAYEQTASSRKSYSQSEARARADRTGLWRKANPVAPWDFREGKTTSEIRDVKAAAAAAMPAAITPSGTSAKRKYTLGPRGGCYYVSPSGRKVYVSDKGLCAPSQAGTKP